MADELRRILEAEARAGGPVTYRELVGQLDLRPPLALHRLTLLLEALMAEDAAAGRPLLAALVVSQAGTALPRPGFFEQAAALGRYQGPASGTAAERFHDAELARLRRFYRPDNQRQ